MKSFEDLKEKIVLSKSGYFFTKTDTRKISNNSINDLFKKVSIGKEGHFLAKIINQVIVVGESNWNLSFCVFANISKPSFLVEEIVKWEEKKLSYLLLAQKDSNIILTKKNVKGLNVFLNSLDNIDYETITSAFVEPDSQFESFTLQNMNISDNAMRRKSVSALNLEESFSILGANTYILQNLRINNSGAKTTVGTGTSRVNQLGAKLLLKDYCSWGDDVVSKIDNSGKSDSFLSVFSKPVLLEDHIEDLIPIAILIDVSSLLSLLELGLIDRILSRSFEDGEIVESEVDYKNVISRFDKLLDVVFDVEENKYLIRNAVFADAEVVINKKGITVRSNTAKQIFLIDNEGNEKSLVDFINQRNDIIVSFENLEFVYSKRILFYDSKLLESTKYILDMFKPIEELNHTTKEKNINAVTADQEEFELGTVFRAVEDRYLDDYEYFICDDTNDEWADHIGISKNKISFYHSKSKNAKFSASAFHDVIGQAQKNYGNVLASTLNLELKKAKWAGNWSMKGESSIPYLRRGDSVDNAIDLWNRNINSPNKELEVNIVVDFISFEDFKDRLDKLRNGADFKEKKQVIQILWYLTTLLATSQELNMKTYVICKP